MCMPLVNLGSIAHGVAPINDHRTIWPAETHYHSLTQVFSHFVSRDTCTGVEMRLPIEPLVGVLRHPTAASACRPEGSTALLAPEHDITIADDHIQNKG